MVSDKRFDHPKGEQRRLMNILPYILTTITDKLTSRAGLLAIAQVMESLHLFERMNKALMIKTFNMRLGLKSCAVIKEQVTVLTAAVNVVIFD